MSKLLLWTICCLSLVSSLEAATTAPPTIAESTTWTKSGSPYQVNGTTTIDAGATLTVEPGVQVRFASNARLTVRGTLKAIGTAAEPITFTGTTAQPAWWQGIEIFGTSTVPNIGSELQHVIVEYGGLTSSNATALYIQHGSVRISHATIRHSGRHGVLGWTRGVAHISDTTFIGNAGYAVRFIDGVNPVLGPLSASGNGVDGVGLGGAAYLEGHHTWEATGVPYIVLGLQIVTPGATLTVEDGAEVRFAQFNSLLVQGRLVAAGTAGRGILFTGTTAEPGWWGGLDVHDVTNGTARADLAHTTVAYGGRGQTDANVRVERGQVTIRNSVIRDGGSHGVLVRTSTAASVIEKSHIVNNAGFGIRNDDIRPSGLVLAANNWWGASSGPAVESGCNPGGTGNQVSARVAFMPFLEAPDADPGILPPGHARILSLSPERWFVPADGVTRLWVQLTLRDGNGRPLPGRVVHLTTTRGTAVSGGVTDVTGRTRAYVRSSTQGDAELTARLGPDACELAASPTASVTFTAPETAMDLLPNTAAPYVSNDIRADPMPIVRGVPTRLRVTFRNPTSAPVLVEVTFGFATASIGLAFGPIATVSDQLVPAHGEKVVETVWTPLVSGHYCIEVQYSSRPALAGPLLASGGGGGGTSTRRRNVKVYPGPMGSPKEKESLDKADKAFKVVNRFGGRAGRHLAIQRGLIAGWWQWTSDTARKISQGLGFDPPRQDYRILAMPERRTLPPTLPDATVSPARAAALNAITDLLLDAIAFGEAAVISLDRYAGAAEAVQSRADRSQFAWPSVQAAALLHYKKEMGARLLKIDGAIEALRQVVRDEGGQDVLVTAADIREYQDRLATEGFSSGELADALAYGLSAEEIEAIRLEIIAGDPAEATGSALAFLENLARSFRELGEVLLNPPNFPPIGVSAIGGGGGAVLAGTGDNRLARVFRQTSTIEVGNPLAQPAVIDLRVRRLDLPPDWLVEVSPASVVLSPGEQTSVTVIVDPAGSTAQGTLARVAVEGYAGGELLGGVTVDVSVPQAAVFGGARDTDSDGLPDDWEQQYGLRPSSDDGDDGPNGDPDDDGLTNLEELFAGTDPTIPNTWNLSEGATFFFVERLAFANPGVERAEFDVTFLREAGDPIVRSYALDGHRRLTVVVNEIPGLESAAVSAVVNTTKGGVVVERTMMWDSRDGSFYAGHTGKGIQGARTRWYLAEGDANFFDTWILFANANATSTEVLVSYLLENGTTIPAAYTVGPHARLTVFANAVPGLAGHPFSATITSSQPITVERAMYFGRPGQRFWEGGHASAAVTEPAANWFVAEGRTGPFFDTYLLLANPGADAARATIRYLKPGGGVVERVHDLAPTSRTTILVDGVPGLEDTDVSASIAATQPIIVERAMYWPEPYTRWYGAHNSAGVTATGTRWALAEGEVGGERDHYTYILLANTGTSPAAVRITFLRTGAPPVVKEYSVAPTSRFTVWVNALVPELANEPFGALVESLDGAPLVVERAMYWSSGGQFWAAGTNETAVRLR
jgi:hypothetical protein